MMVAKEQLRLGQRVWFGVEKREGVVDAITRTFVGLVMADGGYVVAGWDEIEVCI